MTKKDFIALADALRESRPCEVAGEIEESCGTAHDIDEHNAAWNQWTSTRQAIATVCASGNPRFDVCRFLDWTEKEKANA